MVLREIERNGLERIMGYRGEMAPVLIEAELTHSVIGSSYEAYNTLGYGFLEHHYATALERELLAKGHKVQREFQVVVRYKGDELGHHRLDMVVDDRLVVEVKATEGLHRNAVRQLYNYLRATNLEVGLLLHFSPNGLKFYREIHSADRKRSVKAGPPIQGIERLNDH